MLKFHINISGKRWKSEVLKGMFNEFKYSGHTFNGFEKLVTSKNFNEFINSVKELDGFFSVVLISENIILAAVDHIRSTPLFYANYKDKFYLSNDAEWIRSKINIYKLSKKSVREFKLTGYVTGENTLVEEVKQLLAGESLCVSSNYEKITLIKKNHFKLERNEPSTVMQEALCEELIAVTAKSIRKLINYANGRQIVIPLSGGYDSRLIALMLKKHGYHNILSFTYGRLGNEESEVSRKIAAELGIEWKFIEYDNLIWKSEWKSKARLDYQIYASGLCTLPHIQDWIAVKYLKKYKLIEKNAVFVPGHSGDFIAGSHIPKEFFKNKIFSVKDIVYQILKKHYSLSRQPLRDMLSRVWKKKLFNQIKVIKKQPLSGWQCASIFEVWDWRERQSKFICNSVRVYEFWQCDWWLPLWDIDFIKFWENVPLNLKKNREWYIRMVQSEYSKHTSISESKLLKNPSAEPKESSLIKKIVKLLLPNFLFDLIIRFRVMNHYNKSSLNIFSVLSPLNYKYLTLKGISANGILSCIYISELQSYLKIRSEK